MNEKQAGELTQGSHWFRFWMPYYFEKLEHPKFKWVYLPVNRNYKPLGISSDKWVDYDSFMNSHAVRFSRDPITFEGIWRGVDPDELFLYNDDRKSRLDYFERLGKLMEKSIELVGG